MFPLFEPFWLEANSSDKLADETWSAYARRSCEEVLLRFNALLHDFKEAAGKFGPGQVESGTCSFTGCSTHTFVTESTVSFT